MAGYNPTKHTALNKPPAVSGPIPSDAKNMYYDEGRAIWRCFQSVDEVSGFYKQYERNPTFEIYVNNSTLNSDGSFSDPDAVKIYWYRNGIDLIEKTPEIDLSDYTTNDQLNQILSDNYYDRDAIDINSTNILNASNEYTDSEISELGTTTTVDRTFTPTQETGTDFPLSMQAIGFLSAMLDCVPLSPMVDYNITNNTDGTAILTLLKPVVVGWEYRLILNYKSINA